MGTSSGLESYEGHDRRSDRRKANAAGRSPMGRPSELGTSENGSRGSSPPLAPKFFEIAAEAGADRDSRRDQAGVDAGRRRIVAGEACARRPRSASSAAGFRNA